jgi:hypothetical protein
MPQLNSNIPYKRIWSSVKGAMSAMRSADRIGINMATSALRNDVPAAAKIMRDSVGVSGGTLRMGNVRMNLRKTPLSPLAIGAGIGGAVGGVYGYSSGGDIRSTAMGALTGAGLGAAAGFGHSVFSAYRGATTRAGAMAAMRRGYSAPRLAAPRVAGAHPYVMRPDIQGAGFTMKGAGWSPY